MAKSPASRIIRHRIVPYLDTSGAQTHLLILQEVARLLQVPLSWVYGRLRKRSLGRLPGYRLGKYWRFREEEIWGWVETQHGGHRAA
ncbi:MAG: hypothetical protein DMG33_05435 [Acidobacteria bacterium]|nr:MAG: hypothetical protein DMG33_05435 [Acidobacteriota bacterium]